MLSFSKIVKEEILEVIKNDNNFEYQNIHLITFILNDLIIEKEEYVLKTTSVAWMRYIMEVIKKKFPITKYRLVIREYNHFQKRKKKYFLFLQDDYLLTKLNVLDNEKIIIPKLIYKDDRTIKEFFKVLFYLTGSINDPKIQRQYHLELFVNSNTMTDFIVLYGEKYDINFKKTARKNIVSLYLNKGEEIADFLKLINAIRALFEFENHRFIRDIRVTENRLINAEVANEYKSRGASLKQLEAIAKLKSSGEYNKLKDKTIFVAKLREKNPESTLSELVELCDIKISKSNIRHHLNKIIETANRIKEEV